MNINNIKRPELNGSQEFRFGKMFNGIFENRSSDGVGRLTSGLLGTTDFGALGSLGTTEVSKVGSFITNIHSNQLISQNSCSLGLMALPYGLDRSDDCLRQFFDRAETGIFENPVNISIQNSAERRFKK